MLTREAVINEARTWIGTPFHHGQIVKGVGVDCVGLIRGIGQAFGINVEGRIAYSMRPDGTLQGEMDQRLRRVTQAEPADILLMSFGGAPHHVALYTGRTIIHAHFKARRCVEQTMTDYWWSLTRGIYRYDGLLVAEGE